MPSNVRLALALAMAAVVAVVAGVWIFGSGGHANVVPFVATLIGLATLVVVPVLVLVFRRTFERRPWAVYLATAAVPMAIVSIPFVIRHFPLHWTGTVDDIQITNLRVTPKRHGPTGQPVSLVLSFDLGVDRPWRGSPRAHLDWSAGLVLHGNHLFHGGFSAGPGRISPEPEILRRQEPRMYSDFGFVPGATYRIEQEFVPPFLTNRMEQAVKELRMDSVPVGCLIRSIFGRSEPEHALGLAAVLASNHAAYRLSIQLDDRRGGDSRVLRQQVNVVPLGALYLGLQQAGTPLCDTPDG